MPIPCHLMPIPCHLLPKSPHHLIAVSAPPAQGVDVAALLGDDVRQQLYRAEVRARAVPGPTLVWVHRRALHCPAWRPGRGTVGGRFAPRTPALSPPLLVTLPPLTTLPRVPLLPEIAGG